MRNQGERIFGMNYSLTFATILAIAATLSGCAARSDVEISVADMSLDTLNPMLPPLANALPKHPSADTFIVRGRVVPDATRPREFLSKSLIYSRRQHTLEYHHDAAFYEIFSGVTDEIIIPIAAKKGGVRLLLVAGCKRSFKTE